MVVGTTVHAVLGQIIASYTVRLRTIVYSG